MLPSLQGVKICKIYCDILLSCQNVYPTKKCKLLNNAFKRRFFFNSDKNSRRNIIYCSLVTIGEYTNLCGFGKVHRRTDT